MEKDLRNTLRNVVTQCRKQLEQAITEMLQGQFGIHPTGEVEDAARLPHLSAEDWEYRDRIVIHLNHIQSAGLKTKDAVAQLVREAAFTHLNRLCAYKLMATRGLIDDPVGKVLKSRGFIFYLADHPEDERLHAGSEQARAYRHYLEWLNDTLSQEIGALFSAQDLASGLFPPHRVLESVLALLNSEELKEIWTEDETIGWVYQYFTPKELRDKARKESAAPRNSYELAFRNQFFTPRYIVEFLTDNTLGRTWYEIRKGNTALAASCRYLVRRPNEVFLAPGEAAPETSAQAEDLSKEELLKQPVYISHRAKKDPREIKALDPACGSGHFLLYCFDLFQTIYEEAYEDAELGARLKSDYPDLAEFRRNIPALILAHNLHGIDIDLRATQIAALALWLRAQRAWHEMKLKREERPPVTRLHVVCAEPMPGEPELLDDFVAELQPRLLGQLVRVVFEKMKLAGEAGSLLRIEDEISEPIAQAKKEWQTQPEPEQWSLFDDARTKVRQQSLFDVRSVTDAQFWDDAEAKVIDALREYASRAANGQGILRRLFADDALQGFAFVDLCRQKFDVVLMNPPFGDASKPSKAYIERAYPRTKNDIYAAFVERGLGLLHRGGMLGAITSRTGFFLSSFQKWREEIILKEARPVILADLGYGVLDTAMVETAAYCIEASGNVDFLSCRSITESLFLRLLQDVDKTAALADTIASVRAGRADHPAIYVVNPASFQRVPTSPFAYWVSERIQRLFTELSSFEGEERAAKKGVSTGDDFRFVRTWWEVSPEKTVTGITEMGPDEFRQQTCTTKRWVPFAKGGAYSPYYADLHLVVNWGNNGEHIRAFAGAFIRNEGYYFRPGLTWSDRTTSGITFRTFPAGAVFAAKGPVAFAKELSKWLSILQARVFERLISLQLGAADAAARSYEVGIIQRAPIPKLDGIEANELGASALSAINLKRVLDTTNEISHVFHLPALLRSNIGKLINNIVEWQSRVDESEKQLAERQREIDDIAFRLYCINDEDRRAMETSLNGPPSAVHDDTNVDDDEIEDEPLATNHRQLTADLLAYFVGCAFGRWDVRFATGERAAPELPDPFAPLPVCAPGALQGEDGLPLSETPPGYPLRIDWDGILTDDPEHPDDNVRRVRDVFELLWSERAEAIEREACELLGVSTLRDYFRKPAAGGFWQDHVKRYSKSRRKAPIYWLLQSSKKNYGLWLYYHRLDKDMLFKALLNYVEPKLRLEENKLEQLRTQRTSVGAAGREAKQLEKQLDRQEALMSELRDFRDKLERAAKLGLESDLNDGVVLNIAPLWELVPWAEAKKYWEELKDGKYEWSAIGRQLREKGLVK